MATPRYSAYRDANQAETDAHPVDDEVDRRLRHRELSRRIAAEQDRVVAALGARRRLYLGLEELIAQRSDDREEAMFNLGYEHGLLQGRNDATAALWRKSTRGRTFACQIGRLAVKTGLDRPQAVAALLEIAWSLSIPRRRRGAVRLTEKP